MSQMIAVASRLAPRPPILTVSSQSCQQPRSNLAWTFLPLQLLRHTPTSALGTWNVLLQNRHVAGTWFLAQMSPFNEVFLATLHLKWSSVNTHAHARTHTYGLLENPAGHSLLQELSLTSPPSPDVPPFLQGLIASTEWSPHPLQPPEVRVVIPVLHSRKVQGESHWERQALSRAIHICHRSSRQA